MFFEPLLSEEEKGKLLNLLRERIFDQLSLTKELIDVLEAFNEANIQVIPLKGPLLSHSLFGSFDKRQSIDLDFLVKREDYFKAEEIILGFGYHSTYYDMRLFTNHQLKTLPEVFLR